MAKKDDIFRTFVENELLREKYKITDTDIPANLRAGLSSEIPVVRAIALIVESQEKKETESESAVYKKVAQMLNTYAV